MSETENSSSAPLVPIVPEAPDLSRAWLDVFGPVPKRVQAAGDSLSADAACRLAAEGTAMLWQGDFNNARQLLDAMAHRLDARANRPRRRGGRLAGGKPAPLRAPTADGVDGFHRWRLGQAQRAQQLARLLVPVDAQWQLPLSRAPDLSDAARQAYGPLEAPAMVPLRALLGAIGAHQWRLHGIELAVLGPAADGPGSARIHPHFGVFAPVRNEYLDLIAAAPLPAALAAQSVAFDLGTGSGVIAILLAHRGVKQVFATDNQQQALTCAEKNRNRLGYRTQIELLLCTADAGLFPPGRAGLIVCNPPWLPGKPGSLLEQGVFDPGERMLGAFLDGVGAHLLPGGQAWLVMSDLAEHLGLRAPGTLEQRIEASGLQVLGRTDIRPRHPKSRDASDPLATARGAERVTLWRLAPTVGDSA